MFGIMVFKSAEGHSIRLILASGNLSAVILMHFSECKLTEYEQDQAFLHRC